MNVKANKTKKQANVENQAVKLIISEQLTPEEENSAKELLNSVIHPKALPVQRHGC